MPYMTTLKLTTMMTFIFLAIIIYLLFILLKTLFSKPFNLRRFCITTLLTFMSFILLLYFFNTEHSLESKIKEENRLKNNVEIGSYTTASAFYDQNDFYVYNFKNKLELPIPNYLELKDHDEVSEFFRFKSELENSNKNISLTGVGLTVEPKKSSLTQDNVSKITDKEMDDFLNINKVFTEALLPSWGLVDYEITNSSITTGTSNNKCNFIRLNYELNNHGRQANVHLLLVPTSKEIIRILTFSYPENDSDISTVTENIKLVP